MPSKRLEAARVADFGPAADKRRKLTNEQREEIKALKGSASVRELAIRFHVSRRTIQFIQHPERLKANKALRTADRVREYNRNHTEAMRRHRAHKRNLLENH